MINLELILKEYDCKINPKSLQQKKDSTKADSNNRDSTKPGSNNRNSTKPGSSNRNSTETVKPNNESKSADRDSTNVNKNNAPVIVSDCHVGNYNPSPVITRFNSSKLDLQSSNDPVVWPENFLPYTKYMRKMSEKNLDKIERWKTDKLLNDKRLVQTLTLIDLDLLRALTAEDLISYDGNDPSVSIQHIQNRDKLLIAVLSGDFETRRLFRFLKYALLYKNYNLIFLLLKALQTRKLSEKKVKKLLYYKNILDNQEDGIFPLAWMLKDCEDSNLNVESEVASLRFCKIIEKLKEMKNIEYDFEIKEKYKQMLYSKMWDESRKNEVEIRRNECSLENLYLTF